MPNDIASALAPATPPTGSTVAPPTSAGQQLKADQASVEAAASSRDEAGKDKPKFPELTPEPKQGTPDDPMRGYVSTIGIIGALGSAFSRNGATNAMNAAAATLKSMKEGDEAGYQKNKDLWKIQNDNAMKLFDYQTNTYKEIMASKNKSVDERIAEMKANAAAFKDDNMMQLLEARNPAVIEDLLAKADAARSRMDEVTVKLQEASERREAFMEGKAALDADLAAGKINKMQYAEGLKNFANQSAKGGASGGQKEPTWSPESIDKAVEAMHRGKTLSQVAPGLSASNPNRDAIMNAYSKKYPKDDMVGQQLGLVGETSASRALGTTTARINLASNILDSSIPSMLDAAKKVGLKSSTDLNTLYNTIKKHGSSEDLENFSTQLRAVTTDYAQFIGRGSITVHSDEEALKILNNNMGITSLEGFQKAVTKEKNNVKAGIKQTVDEAKGGSDESDDPNRELTPEEQAEYEQLTGKK